MRVEEVGTFWAPTTNHDLLTFSVCVNSGHLVIRLLVALRRAERPPNILPTGVNYERTCRWRTA